MPPLLSILHNVSTEIVFNVRSDVRFAIFRHYKYMCVDFIFRVDKYSLVFILLEACCRVFIVAVSKMLLLFVQYQYVKADNLSRHLNNTTAKTFLYNTN